MKTFKVVYKMVVLIEAETKEEAQEKFNTSNLQEEFNPEYLGQISIEECSKNEAELYVGVDVEVPPPNPDDLWNFEFVGVVVSLDKNSQLAVVEDGDGDCWSVEFNRLKLL